MKKITLFFLLFTFAAAFSQIKKGQYLLGGNISFESTKQQNDINSTFQSNDFDIAPNIGYFIVDKLAGGVRLNFRFYDSKSVDLHIHSTSTSISPFLRYYFLPVPKKINVLIDVSYINNKTKISSSLSSKERGYYIFAGPSVFLTPIVALEFTFGYEHTLSEDFGNTESSVIKSGIGLQVHLGKNKKHR